MYDTARREFVHWFTGILMPFQYARDDAEVRRYLGAQITGALSPVARELRKRRGNYTRTMCESVHPVLLAYRTERAHGHEHPEWLPPGGGLGGLLLGPPAPDPP